MLHLHANLKKWGYLALFSCVLLYNSCAIYIEIPSNACDLPTREVTISCHSFNVDFTGQGWITFIGDGNLLEIKAFANGNFMEFVRVYEGSDCNNLTLVTSSDQFQSIFSFQSVDGQRYFVQLEDAFGYESTIEICNDGVANNDVCIDAIEWLPNTLLLGSLENATNTAVPPECIQQNGKGVWFTMQGDGQTYNLNILNADLNIVLFLAGIGSEEIHYNIYEGDCSNLVCVLGKDGLGPTMFPTEVGKTYYIYVTRRNQNQDASFNFMLTKSTCTDLIDGITIESCPGSDQSTIKVSTTQANVTFAMPFIYEDEGIEYSVVFGDPDSGPVTTNSGNFTITAPLEGYVLAFVGNDPYSALCWDYIYFNVTGNEPDLTTPKAKCKDYTLKLDQQGMATLEVSMVDNGSFDNCSITSEVLSETNFTCDDIGDHTVTLTIEDAAGLNDFCTSTVTVVDDILPTALCNNLTVTLDENGIKNLLVEQIDNGSSDNCSIQNRVLSPPIVDCDDALIGGGTVQLIVTDNSGNTNSCTSVITVTDDTPPMANCMNATVTLDNNGEGLLIPSDIDNNSFDACGISRFILDVSTFDCDDVGQSISVELTLTDNNMNSSSCTANVTVVDDMPPTAVCKTTTVEIQPDGQYVLELSDIYDEVNSFDNCEIASSNFDPITFTCDELDQTFPIPVTVIDASGNTGNCTAPVSVVLGTALPDGWNTSDIGQVTIGNAYSFDPCANDNPVNGEFTIIGSGNNAIGTSTDNIAFASQNLCGDGMITAKIEQVSPNGYGGLMIRETSDVGAKQVSVFSNMTNVLRHETRYFTGTSKQTNSFFKPSPFWLRLHRQGDWIFAYYSTDGYFFQYVHGVNVTMQNCVELGLASFTYLPNAQTTSVFSYVTIGSGNGIFSINEEPLETKPHEVPSSSELSIFPNPTDHSFNVVFEKPSESSKNIQLYNSFGQLVAEQSMEIGAIRMEWEIGHLPEGLYLLSDNKKSFVEQLVISR